MNEQIKRLIKQGESDASITLMTGASYTTINNLRNQLNFEDKKTTKMIKKFENFDNVKYTYIILFKETKDDGIKWDFADETPLISEIGKRVEAKPVSYDDILSFIEEDKENWKGEDSYSHYGDFIGYKIVPIEEFEKHREERYYWGNTDNIIK